METTGKPLPPSTVYWLRTVCGTDAVLNSASELPGATTATLYRLEYTSNGQPLQAVLRLFTNAEWLRQEPDLPEHEAAALQTAALMGLSAPRLLAVENSCVAEPVPALLMTCLPGQVELTPLDIERWLQQQARYLADLHRHDAPAFAWRFRPYIAPAHLAPPQGSSCTRLWQQAIEIVQADAPSYTPRFIHRDFHPVNLLWHDGQLCGVVDWVNACLGPAAIDIAWNRQNLAATHGLAAADHFLELYLQEAGSTWQYDPYWDLLCLTDWLEEPFTVYKPWLDFGLTYLTPELVTERLETYLASLLK
jgi:aminoglycoside phosphotransferase (APT) family kinase protein